MHQHQVMMPRSILKSRRSEESLSPLSDDCVPVISGSGGNAALTGSCDDFRSDEKSADFRFDNQKNSSNNSSSNIRPSILKQRDSSRDEGYHSSKLRDKSRSPSRGATCSPPENINEVVFSGKTIFQSCAAPVKVCINEVVFIGRKKFGPFQKKNLTLIPNLWQKLL